MNDAKKEILGPKFFSSHGWTPSAMNTKVGVRFVNTGVLHSDAWEGSCRTGRTEELTPKAEKARLDAQLASLGRELETVPLPPEVELVAPVSLHAWAEKGNPEIAIPPKQLGALDEGDKKTDLYVVTSAFAGVKIAQRYRKPVIILSEQGWAVDMPPAIRALGIDSFHAESMDAVFGFVRLFAAKKAFARTKLLDVTNFPGRAPWGVNSAITDLDFIKQRYGMDYEYLNYQEFFGEMDGIVTDSAVQDEAREITAALTERAVSNSMEAEEIQNSLLFYLTTARIMAEHGCNAFTIECFELCASQQPEQRRFTPCLTHALLKDAGYPSACEGDINALLAMGVQMYLSREAAYMGNPTVRKEENILNIHHSVASLRMQGIDGAESPYRIYNFTNAGFGATLRHDFTKDKGQVVTVGRFDPSGTRMLVTHGEITGGGGLEGLGCAQNVDIKIPKGYEFWRESQNFGHHLSLVYGDLIHSIRDLGDMMNFEVVAVV